MSSRFVVNGVFMLASLVTAIVLGALAAISFTWAFFSNTRGDGFAAFLIAFIGTGMFVNVVAFAWIAARKQTANGYLVAAQSLIWILLAMYFTWGTCVDDHITLSNIGWILTSNDWQAEVRAYDLHWLIRGWLAVLASGFLSAFASRRIMNRSTSESLVPVTN